MSDGLRTQLQEDARSVLDTLSAGTKSAWELKMALKISHTRLHLALGALIERGGIAMTSSEGTFQVERLEPEAAPIPIRTDRPKIAAP